MFPVLAVPLAHAGEGATWQALLSVLAIGIAVVFVLAVAGRVPLRSGNDLVLPLAAVAIMASLAPTLSSLLSDWVWWAFPLGIVLLAALVLAAMTDAELGLATPLAVSAVAAAALAIVVFDGPITRAWHPPVEFLPQSVDAAVEIVQPEDGAVVDAGAVTVEVAVTGGAIGPGGMTTAEASVGDPEESATLNLFLDAREAEAEPQQDCTLAEPCQSVTYELTDVEEGTHDLVVELVRGDGTPFAPTVFARSTFDAE